MAHYSIETLWSRGDQGFLDNRYSRRHILRFDAGIDVPGSSSPHVVPAPWSDPAAIDPEENFVASISSCHMLWFLSIAAKRKFVVDSYRDTAIGIMDRNELGQLAMVSVVLRPEVIFSGISLPSRDDIDAMHHEAHAECFIANSVRTAITCEPVYR